MHAPGFYDNLINSKGVQIKARTRSLSSRFDEVISPI